MIWGGRGVGYKHLVHYIILDHLKKVVSAKFL